MSGSDALDRHDLRRVVAVLCTTEIISWGVLFYAFPVLATSIADTEGHSLPTLVAIFTGAQVVAALTGIWVGHHLDRHGPRLVMTAGSLLGVGGVVVLASAPGLGGFVAGWAVVGFAMAATLYPPAFAALTHWAGEHRVRALTAVTLVAGLASTVFAPLTAVLAGVTDWRTTYLLLALPLAVTVPLHWWGLRSGWRRSTAASAEHPDESRASRWRDPVVRSRRFAALWVAMTLGGFAVYAVVVNLIPLLEQNGIGTTTAAVALGVGGVGQVAGRLGYQRYLDPLSPGARTALTLGAAAATTALLALVHRPVALVLVVSFTAGLARGVYTLIQATAVSDRWGTESYGARSSLISSSTTVAAASAPWVGAAAAESLDSYARAFLVLAAVGLLAALLAIEPRRHRPAVPETAGSLSGS